MNPITMRSDWGYFDQLEGVDLVDGELLHIEWPDGSTSEHRIEVTDSGYESVKEGHIPNKRACIIVEVRGIPARVDLRAARVKAKRIGPPPPPPPGPPPKCPGRTSVMFALLKCELLEGHEGRHRAGLHLWDNAKP